MAFELRGNHSRNLEIRNLASIINGRYRMVTIIVPYLRCFVAHRERPEQERRVGELTDIERYSKPSEPEQ